MCFVLNWQKSILYHNNQCKRRPLFKDLPFKDGFLQVLADKLEVLRILNSHTRLYRAQISRLKGFGPCRRSSKSLTSGLSNHKSVLSLHMSYWSTTFWWISVSSIKLDKWFPAKKKKSGQRFKTWCNPLHWYKLLYFCHQSLIKLIFQNSWAKKFAD